MPAPFSRRGFLLAAAAAVPLSAASASASADARTARGSAALAAGRPARATYTAPEAPANACTPSNTPPGKMYATGTLGNVTASVAVNVLKDNVAMAYQLTNISDQQGTYIVSYTDEVTTFGSRAITYTLAPGAVQKGVFYGTIDHQFMFYVDLSDGSTLSLGPLNKLPYCALNGRKKRKPIYQPPTRHH